MSWPLLSCSARPSSSTGKSRSTGVASCLLATVLWSPSSAPPFQAPPGLNGGLSLRLDRRPAGLKISACGRGRKQEDPGAQRNGPKPKAATRRKRAPKASSGLRCEPTLALSTVGYSAGSLKATSSVQQRCEQVGNLRPGRRRESLMLWRLEDLLRTTGYVQGKHNSPLHLLSGVVKLLHLHGINKQIQLMPPGQGLWDASAALEEGFSRREDVQHNPGNLALIWPQSKYLPEKQELKDLGQKLGKSYAAGGPFLVSCSGPTFVEDVLRRMGYLLPSEDFEANGEELASLFTKRNRKSLQAAQAVEVGGDLTIEELQALFARQDLLQRWTTPSNDLRARMMVRNWLPNAMDAAEDDVKQVMHSYLPLASSRNLAEKIDIPQTYAGLVDAVLSAGQNW